ncbi:MAG: AAA family ATPase [Sulfurovum sp.]|nr:AAA family ATPase [Sulfurovum sp.]
MKKLPIGISTFSNIIEQNYLYIDKTNMAFELIDNHKYAFLSRPRRFGKSLLISTLKEIFEGNKKLFEGLYIYNKWDWEDKYPVIKISWGGDLRSIKGLKQTAYDIFKENQKRLGIECEMDRNPSSYFRELIIASYEKYKKPVVILIDEYDKPILDNLDQMEVAIACRELIKSIYTQIKENDQYIKFAFLTGVSKFSKASIFSGLNNLEDISLTPRFGTLCGYTQNDIETTFLPYLKGVDLERLKKWYNGYNFLNDTVYNPFDILLFIKNDFLFDNYWFNTGTPSFLIKLFKQNNYNLAEFENLLIGKELIDSFDIENLSLETVMFQAGYLTIKEVVQKRNKIKYILTYPNFETKMSFNDYLVGYFIDNNHIKKSEIQNGLIDTLEIADMSNLELTLKSLFSSIAYNNFTKNQIQNYEGFYASVIYAYFAGAGFDKIIAEDATSVGRIDLSVFIDDKVYIFEFKVDGTSALQQIKDKKYHHKYMRSYKDIYIIGVEFDSDKRAIEKFEWEMVEGGKYHLLTL